MWNGQAFRIFNAFVQTAKERAREGARGCKKVVFSGTDTCLAVHICPLFQVMWPHLHRTERFLFSPSFPVAMTRPCEGKSDTILCANSIFFSLFLANIPCAKLVVKQETGCMSSEMFRLVVKTYDGEEIRRALV